MKRAEMIKRVADSSSVWDLVVIGGGATGLGIAVDAASRGYQVALFELDDFAKCTSSRSTKLVHGGVRYLAQGDIALVFEALHERGLLKQNAPHLVRDQIFVIPNYRQWDRLFYTIGLTFYDLLAGKWSFGVSKWLTRKETIARLPSIQQNGLVGGVEYHDGQFDDARLAINLMQTCVEHGGCPINRMEVVSILHEERGQVCGVEVEDLLTEQKYQIKSKAVINATGIFVDYIMKLDMPTHEHIVQPSQGIHLVLDRLFLPRDSALMIPKTDDGRVLFAVPWHDKVVLGTTDTLRENPEWEPKALEEEVEFVLRTAGRYLTRKPERNDVRSVFAGLRPLAAPKKDGKSTKEISRSHKIYVSKNKLITITGGKWTTYRKMAEDAVNKGIELQLLPPRKCITKNLSIHGYQKEIDVEDHLYIYGADAIAIRTLMTKHTDMARKLHPDYAYTEAEVVWAVREEMAQDVADVLARRVRLLFLDARAALEVAPRVAQIIAKELNYDDLWVEEQIRSFSELAQCYLLT